MSETMEWVMLGRVIGTGSGWDQTDTMSMTIYDFVPTEGVTLPRGTVDFHFETGLATLYSDSGTIIETVDIVDAIAHLPQTSL